VLLSADAVPTHDHWLSSLIRHFEDPQVGAVYGRQIPPEGMGPVRRQMMESEYPDRPQVRTLTGRDRLHPGWFRFSNVNAAVRTELWRRFPWSESVLLAEDQGLCRDVLEAGMKVVYDPEAAVIHGHERTLWEEFRFAVDNSISLTRLHILGNGSIKGELGYGLRRMGRDAAHFLLKGQMVHTARSLLVCAVKWLGVQIGKKEGRLPNWLLRRLSAGYGARSG
jgi:rhamnosyltransferase